MGARYFQVFQTLAPEVAIESRVSSTSPIGRNDYYGFEISSFDRYRIVPNPLIVKPNKRATSTPSIPTIFSIWKHSNALIICTMLKILVCTSLVWRCSVCGFAIPCRLVARSEK